MKYFKKQLILIAFLGVASMTSAQTFGLKAGFNLSNTTLSTLKPESTDQYEFTQFDVTPNPGFHFGATLDFALAESFSIETGLLLTTKGNMVNTSYILNPSSVNYASINTASTKILLYYVDIPLNAKKTFDLGNNKIYGSLGPYLGVILGHSINDTRTENGHITSTYKKGFRYGTFGFGTMLDYGLNIGCGIMINAFQFGVTYGLGLANNLSSAFYPGNTQNRVFSLSIGYNFQKKIQ